MSELRNFLGYIVGTVGSAAEDVKETASEAVNKVEDTASSVASTVKDTASSAYDSAAQTASQAVNKVEDTASSVASTVKDTASSTYNTVAQTASEAVNKVEDTASSVASTVKDKASSAYNSVAQTASEGVNTIKGVVSDVKDTVDSAIDTTVETVKDTVEGVVDTVEETASDVEKAALGISRGLNGAERSAAQGMYQDSIDYDLVTVVSGGLGSAGAPARTLGNTICMADEQFDPATGNLTGSGMVTLIHEMAHVWQYQHGGAAYIPNALGAQLAAWIKTGSRNDAYDFGKAMQQGIPWEQWNAEQQAEAMEKYFECKQRIDAGTPETGDQDIVDTLEPYVGKVRRGEGAPSEMPDVRANPTPLI